MKPHRDCKVGTKNSITAKIQTRTNVQHTLAGDEWAVLAFIIGALVLGAFAPKKTAGLSVLLTVDCATFRPATPPWLAVRCPLWGQEDDERKRSSGPSCLGRGGA